MRSFRIITPLVKSRKAKAVGLALGLLLAVMTTAYAYTQIVSKYPTGYVLGTTAMGNGMTLEKGSVFGFNSAKSAADTEAYATIQEGACATPATLFDFTEGREGFTITTATNVTYGYNGVQGNAAGGALQTRYNKSTTIRNYTWNKAFLWDCGIPAADVPVTIWYKRGTWTSPSATLANMTLRVDLVKPDLTVQNLIASTQISGAANSAWIQLSAASPATVRTYFNQAGIYTLRATGSLQGSSVSGTDLYLFLDDFNLGLTSGYESYVQDVEFTERATPSSASGAYLLDIKARKISGDTETTNIQVCGDNLPTCGSWVTRYSVTSAHPAPFWYLFNTYTLTTAEYNNGNVRIRYVDAIPTADSNRGGIDVEYQRITVNQGVCVDAVADVESDCGKCHNYGADVTKPWPNIGMHNLHAQSESISDCLWCHPDNGTNAGHSDGVVKVTGTKLYRAADGNLNGAPAAAIYDTGGTKQCASVACHMSLTTPAWNATYVASGFNGTTLIARNCSRCHNSAVAGADNASNLNIAVSWPSTGDGGGHNSHNAAVAFDEYSCQSNGSCHPDNRGQHSVVDDGNVIVKMAPNYGSPNSVIKYIKMSAAKSDGICVNVSCHGGQATPKFNLSSTNPINLTLTDGTACIMCHVGEQANGWGTAPGNAMQYNSPISGLHRGSPPTSGQDHAAGLLNGCQACHTLASLTRHFQFGGVTNLDTPEMDSMQGAAFTAATGYFAGTGTAPNYTTPPTCITPVGTTCHAENNTTTFRTTTPGNWKRRWTWDSYAAETPDVEKVKQCNGCHGHWGTFVTGVVEPHVLSNTDSTLRSNLETKHGDSGVNCGTMCHAQNATLPTPYNHGVVVGAASKDMSLNANATPIDNGTTVGCSNACHANDPGVPDGGGIGSHVFADAAWTVTTNHTDGPTISCYNPGAGAGCHGDGVYKSWPTGSPGSYPNRIGDHQIHLDRLATKLGKNLASITQTDQNTMCLYCHNTLSPGLAGHTTDATANQAEVSSFKRIFDGAADTATAGTFATSDSSCSNVDCHNNKATGVTYAWRSAGTSACIMCHSDVTNVADTSHTAHLAATVPTTFGETLTCATCHDASTNWSTNTKPSLNHLNGTFTATLYTGATYPTVKGSCGINTCHNTGKNTATSAYPWGTPRANCTGCHGDATTLAEAHNEHMNNSYTGALCTDCHTSETAATHLNGLVNIDTAKATYSLNGGAVPVATTANGTCSTASCHNKTGNGSSIAWNVAAGTVAGTTDLSCTSCHYYVATVIAGSDAASQAAPSPISLSHRDHLTKLFQCSRCHTVPTTTTHITNKSSLTSGANAALGEAAVAVTGTTTYAAYTASTCTSGGATPNNGIGCHATGAPVWGTAFNTAVNCTNCHTNTTTTQVNPTSGLHNNTLGLKKHDSTLGTGCIACHTTTATHINGTFTANEFTTGTNEYYTNALYTDGTALNRGSCTGSSVNIAAGCHTDNGNWARLWSTEANSASTATSSTRCNVCHGQWSTIANSSGWMAGTSHFKAGGLNVATNGRGKGHDDNSCNNCHLYGASGNARHNVVTRQINLNSNNATPARTNNTYGSGTAGCGTCHGTQTDANYNYPISYFPVLNVGTGTAFIAPTCISCHANGDNITTPLVSATSSHVMANGISFGACEDCHAKHADATAAGSNVIYVSTVYTGTTAVPTMTKADGTTALYGSGAHAYRIRLGGTVQNGGAKTTEAEWCWGCHDTLTTNLKTLTGLSVTFTNTSATVGTIAATGINTKFPVGSWITISGSTAAANNRTFKVATIGTNTLTVTIQSGDGPLTTATNATGVTIVSPISEWGVNEDAATGSITYDYGDLYTDTTTRFGVRTSNWITGSWRSGKGRVGGTAGDGAYNPYWYKRGAIKSTHSANYDAATATPGAVEGTNWKAMTSGANAAGYNRTETLDVVANIRCSYCHDVHGNHNSIKGDTTGGAPYLRGTWKGNPYAEDGAPQWGMANFKIQGSATVANNDVNSSQYGIVPRASASTVNSGLTTVAKVGGYWIDQNSNDPNAGSSSTLTAGLCDQCHGSAAKDGTWTAAEIGTIDQITGENLWISGTAYNGHGNSVISGSGGNGATAPAAASAEIRARNIFTRTLRGWSTLATGGTPAGQQANMGAIGAARGYSYRGTMAVNWLPKTFSTTTTGAGAQNPYAYSFFAWGTAPSVKNTAASGVQLTQPTTAGAEAAHDAQLNFHTFTCSKCHNPHASRLPKLMITNCLDSNHNTWEDNSIYTGTALSAPWTGLRHSQWATAQTCHRLDARAVLVTSPVTTLGPGWNKVTPWQESTAPNTATATNPNP